MLAITLAAVMAAAAEPHVTTYDLYSKGLRVGSVRTERQRVQRDGRELVSCRVKTDVNVRIPFFRYSLDSEEECLIDEQGAVAYWQIRKEDGNRRTIQGELTDGAFLFTIRDNDEIRTEAISREDYDMTSMDSVELQLARPGDEQTLRILDLNLLVLVERRYHWVKSEKIAMGGTAVSSRVVDFMDPNKQIRRWVTGDDLGLVIVRQNGREQAGSYSMRLARTGPRFPAGRREISVGLSASP
jgi:hypothetical protein